MRTDAVGLSEIKNHPLIFSGWFGLVVPPGFEPRLAESESDVLPLHHGTIFLVLFEKVSTKVQRFFILPNNFSIFLVFFLKNVFCFIKYAGCQFSLQGVFLGLVYNISEI